MKEIKSFADMEKLCKRTIWNEIEYWGFYVWYNWLIDLPRNIKWFIQRGRRGYADCDTWNLDVHLAEVIVGALSELKEYYHGEEHVKEKFEKIITTFKLYLEMVDTPRKLTEEEDKQYYQGWILFKKYYTHLWD